MVYNLLNNIFIEGFDNELTLLFSILKDRTDIGCLNHGHSCLNYGLNWSLKTYQKDENFFLCNNSSENSIVSTLNTGNKCNKELCCENLLCSSKFFSQGYTCGDKSIIPSATCPEQKYGIECTDYCCGEPLSGNIREMFNSIKTFRDTI